MTSTIYDNSCTLLGLQRATLELQKNLESFQAECHEAALKTAINS